MQYSAVIFDLDGTLLDTLADIALAANNVLIQHGLPDHPIDDYRLFVGAGVRELFRQAIPEDQRSDAAISKCVADFPEAYNRCWNVNTRPYEGIPELLEELSQRPLETAILSNKPDVFTKRCVEEYFPHGQFRMVLGQRDGIPRKPDPAGALELAEYLSLSPERCLYLGDSGIDMQTAVAAGMHPVGVSWGFRSRQELTDGGACAVIDAPSELLDQLG